MSEFDDKTVLVTGAAGALGLAVADIFSTSGARVVGVARGLRVVAVLRHQQRVPVAGGHERRPQRARRAALLAVRRRLRQRRRRGAVARGARGRARQRGLA